MPTELRPRCQQCGDTKPLNALGVCRWRHGCEHRQFQHVERMRRLEEEMQRADRRQAGWVTISSVDIEPWDASTTLSTETLHGFIELGTTSCHALDPDEVRRLMGWPDPDDEPWWSDEDE